MVVRWRFRRRGVSVVSMTAGLFAIFIPNERASAGVVSFEPQTINIDSSVHTVTFDLILESTEFAAFDGIDVVVGSHDGLLLTGFDLSPEAESASFFVFNSVAVPGPEKYGSDIKFGFFSAAGLQSVPFPLGTLTVDVPSGFWGSFDVVIDAAFDQQSFLANGLPTEPLFGVGRVYAGIPEPATLTLLGFASLAVVYRGRSG